MYRFSKNKLTKWSDQIDKKFLLNKKKKSTSENIPSTVNLPESADVVIIGGGSAGCNALYNLAKNGKNAILLEKSKLTSGTTWHTAGMVWSLRPNDVEVELLRNSRKVYENLERETGINPGWINNGGIFIAYDKVRMDEYKRLYTIGKSFGIESSLISPKEAKNLFPPIDENAFYGALYSPNDGIIDPAMMVNSLIQSAKSNGAKIFEDCPVTKILIDKPEYGSQKVTGVETPYGIIKTNCILNACGAWSRNIAKMIGVEIPLIPMKHAYIVTEPMKNVKDLPNIRDHDGKIYIKPQGESLSIGGYEPNPIILQSVAKDFSFSLYELDWNVFNSHIEAMVKLIPKLSTTGIRTTVCGPESFTPDHKPIMGEDPRCEGFFYSCGYNSAGMMFGAGCGEQISKWIINGRPEKYMFKYDIRRFTPEQMKDAIWANERSHEAYVKNYSTVFPHDQPLSGRNFKTGPFHKLLINEGAIMEESQGWEKPGFFLKNENITIESYDYCGSYGSPKNENNKYLSILEGDYQFTFSKYHDIIKEEAHACRNNAALFDLSYFGKFYLCGPDVQKVADYLFISDTNVKNNEIVDTCMLNDDGGVEANCTVTSISAGSAGVIDPIFQGKALYIVTSGMSAYHTWAHMREIIKRKEFHVSLHTATDQIGILSIEGPKSQKILQKIVDTDIGDEELPFSHSMLLKINGKLTRILRFTEVGELGYQIHIPLESCETVYNALKKIDESSLKLAGFRALYSLRREKGYPLWGYDLRSDDNPIEAGLSFMCRNDKEYLGREIVQKLKENGVKKRLAHFILKDQIPVWGLETIYRNGIVVGYLRQGDYAYTLDKSIGQGYVTNPKGDFVTNKFLESGEYEIEIMGKKYPAQLYLESPFDPNNDRMKIQYKNQNM
ncbi:sarcosine dehydrogenase, mitochondrial [Leptopilina boulardi]|uniref:sarcosine dehydrogenase, mitochondrial n=1 Tax=Leptopilina boulardi TaxID=63433 RepID=UPI0021F664AE|nr:sarcosine dehydrogenase, mitochondrial [Leptopilina boulardi]XP_051158866.1 sarcosine dehydrogenase, mitochondrial [Leptopilina boulardi]